MIGAVRQRREEHEETVNRKGRTLGLEASRDQAGSNEGRTLCETGRQVAENSIDLCLVEEGGRERPL